MDGGAVAVAEYLKFDVARVAQIFFHIDGRVAKGRRCLARRLAHQAFKAVGVGHYLHAAAAAARRSEEHTSELQSLMRISYAVFCLKKNNKHISILLYTHNNHIMQT